MEQFRSKHKQDTERVGGRDVEESSGVCAK